jgi:protein-tyrosine phosphatase
MREVSEQLHISDAKYYQEEVVRENSKEYDLVVDLSGSGTHLPREHETQVVQVDLDDSKDVSYEDFATAVAPVMMRLREPEATILVFCDAGASRSVCISAAALAVEYQNSFRETLDDCKLGGIEPHLTLQNHCKQFIENGGRL